MRKIQFKASKEGSEATFGDKLDANLVDGTFGHQSLQGSTRNQNSKDIYGEKPKVTNKNISSSQLHF